MSAFWMSVVWLVGLTWLIGGLSWQRFIASRKASYEDWQHRGWQQALTVLQILSASCGLLILVTFIALPTVRLSSPISSSWGVTNALYDSDAPLLAVTRLEPLLWLIVLAAIFVLVAVNLSQDKSSKGLKGLALLLALASALGFAVLAMWWRVAQQPVYLELADQGGAVWVCAFLGVGLGTLANTYKRHKVALRTLMILLVSLVWLGLNLPGVSRQLPILTGYYTWLEPARPSVGIYADSFLTNALTPTSFAYGGWLLVIVLAFLMVLAAATHQVAVAIEQHQAYKKISLAKPLSDKHRLVQAEYGRSSRRTRQPQRTSRILVPRKNIWRDAIILCLSTALLIVSVRYVSSLNDAVSTQDVTLMTQPEFWQGMGASSWLRVPPPLTVQLWLAALLTTVALTVTPAALALILAWGVSYTSRGYQQRLKHILVMVMLLAVLMLIIYMQLDVGHLQQSVWLLGLVGLLYWLEHPAKPQHLKARHLLRHLLFLSIFLGALTSQGLGGVLVTMLAANSAAGVGIIAVTLLAMVMLLEARADDLTDM